MAASTVESNNRMAATSGLTVASSPAAAAAADLKRPAKLNMIAYFRIKVNGSIAACGDSRVFSLSRAGPGRGVVQNDLQQGDKRPCPTDPSRAVHYCRLGLHESNRQLSLNATELDTLRFVILIETIIMTSNEWPTLSQFHNFTCGCESLACSASASIASRSTPAAAPSKACKPPAPPQLDWS